MRQLQTLLTSKGIEWFINIAILLYAVVLGAESFVTTDSTLHHELRLVERALLLTLCIEVAVRAVLALRQWAVERELTKDNEFRSSWFHFDVITTVLGFIPGFEAFRAYRLLRLIGRFEFFKHPIELLFRALRHSVSLAALAGFLVIVNGLVSNKAFGIAFPDAFGRIDRAVLSSLFLVFFDDLGNRYLEMYALNPIVMILHTIVTLLVGVLIMALFVSTVLDVREQLRKEHEEEDRKLAEAENSRH